MTYYSPSISVIVATYNRPQTLLRLLNLINDQRCVNFHNIEVCIVDDGSPVDQTGTFPTYDFHFEYVYRERHPDGTARVYSSRNIAAAKTNGEFILQLDDDVEFHPYFLNLLQSLAGVVQEKHWVWCPRVSNNIDVDKSPRNESNWDRGKDGRWFDGRVYWQESHWGSADSSAMFMPRLTWIAVGGYDIQFDGAMGCADQELALRIQKLGHRPGDVKLWVAPYFVNKADEETGSWRMPMIYKRKRAETNEDLMFKKHPDMMEWQI